MDFALGKIGKCSKKVQKIPGKDQMASKCVFEDLSHTKAPKQATSKRHINESPSNQLRNIKKHHFL